MVVVDDLRFPVPIHASDRARLDLVDHVSVTVVVVTDVLLIKKRCACDFVLRADVRVVPVGDHGLAVGVYAGPENQNDIVENGCDLRVIVPGDQVIRQLDRVLSVRDLTRVHAAIDVHNRLPFPGESLRIFVGHVVRRISELLRDLPIPLGVAKIFGGRNQCDVPRPPKARDPDFPHLDTVRGSVEGLEVLHRLLVIGELKICAHLITEHGFRPGHLG